MIVKKNSKKYINKREWKRVSNPNRGIYDKQAWRGSGGLRITRLRSEPFCRICGNPASEVDHIIPINHGGDAWDFENTQSLCGSCHKSKTAAERWQIEQKV